MAATPWPKAFKKDLQASDCVIQSRRKNDLRNMFPRCKMCTNCAGYKLVQCPNILKNQSSPHKDEGQMWGIPDLSITYLQVKNYAQEKNTLKNRFIEGFYFILATHKM